MNKKMTRVGVSECLVLARMFHVCPIALNPLAHYFLFSPSRNPQLSLTLKFSAKCKNLRALSPSLFPTPQYDDYEDHVIGDCVVFEDGIFDDPVSQTQLSSDNLSINKPKPKPKPRPRPKKKVADNLCENLVPDKWREIQAEINLTKRERRKIAREIEFNRNVDKMRRGLVPLRDMNLEEYKAYKEAKLSHMKLLHNASTVPANENEPQTELNVAEEEVSQPEPELNGAERVLPKNPRWAVYGRGFEDVTEFFNSLNYDPASKTSQGRRKLFTKEEKVLLNKRVPDLAAATSDKWLPLHTLAACGEFNLLDSLLKHNVDINAVDKDGLTVLHRAIIGKRQAITNYLLRNSANPFVQDKEGATLMHYAVLTASTQTIKILLLHNVDINLQDNYGWTPLHLAVQAQRTDLVKLLLIKGADKTLKNKDGLTPLDLCLYFGQSGRTYELIKLFKQPQRRVRRVSVRQMGPRNNTIFERFGPTNEVLRDS